MNELDETSHSQAPSPVDLRIDAGWVIPVEPEGIALAGHSVLLRAGRIVAVLPTGEAGRLYTARQVLRLPEHALLPGLVNLHTHAAMTLLRGLADDRPLMTWLKEHIWPAEARWVSPEFVRDGTRLACVEMLLGGITCFNDMYFFPDAAVEAAIAARQRIAAGIIVIDFASAWAADADAYLDRGLAMYDAWRHHPLFSACLAPHAPYSTSDRSLEKVLTYAGQLDLPVHMHVHETEDEIRQGIEQHGVRPLARLHHLGLITPQFIAVHGVHLNADEIALLAGCGSHVAHCPSSNLKLAAGLAPVAALLDQGVSVGLGSDGAASNNRLDLWEEMRLAALLAKGTSGRADALPAARALTLATLGGARALGLEAEIGSIEAGKAADLIAVDLSGPDCQPLYDPISQLVYSASREKVSHVWVAGEAVVEDGAFTTLDTREVLHRVHQWRERIAG